MAGLRALIFDVDGTLAETEELHRAAFNQSFAHFAETNDWHWDSDLYGALLTTAGGKERIAAYWRGCRPDAPDAALIAALHAAKTRAYETLVAQGGLQLRPGIADLIEDARRIDCRLAIASTTSRANIDALCQSCFQAPAAAIFPIIAAGDEVSAKKPAPDIYRLALERLALLPQDCLAFEDSGNGLRSAQAAGLRCIVTPSRYSAAENFTSADLLLEDLSSINCVTQILAKLYDSAGHQSKQ